jgi:hypothetical protein
MRASTNFVWIWVIVGTAACSSSNDEGAPTIDSGANGDDAAKNETGVDADVVDASDTGGLPPQCAAPLAAMTDACRTCLEEACMTEAADCCKATSPGDGGAVGCLPLLACALRTKCVHAACADPSTCGREVDGAGGPSGEAVNVGAAVGACIQGAASKNPSCAECLK